MQLSAANGLGYFTDSGRLINAKSMIYLFLEFLFIFELMLKQNSFL
jgi:hypothetical protein